MWNLKIRVIAIKNNLIYNIYCTTIKIKKEGLGMRWKFKNIYKVNHEEIFDDIDFSVVLRLVIDGILVGAIGGFFASMFRYSLQYFEEEREVFMQNTDPLMVVLWLTVMGFLGYLTYLFLKWAPISGGSGIPQIEGEMQGLFNMNASRTLIAKYFGGSLTSMGGFSVGREGPSIQVGGAAGKMISQFLKRPLRQERILTSAGAAAGLSAAFNAPISGAIFIFEEVHKSFYPALVIPTFTASLVSNYVATLVFGLGPSLGFSVDRSVEIHDLPYLILLGIFIGFIGVIFNSSLVWFKDFFDSNKLPKSINIILTFITVSIIGYFAADLLGGGNALVKKLYEGYGGSMLYFLLFLVFGKILLTTFCYGCGAPGGIFLPILVVGAAAGSFFYHVLMNLGIYTPDMLGVYIICAMGGIMSSSIRSPLLAILLVLEMTQSFECTYAVSIVTIISYLIAEMLKVPPIYDKLLDMMIKKENVVEEQSQTFFEAQIPITSSLIDKELREITFPQGTIVVGIRRQGERITPTATTKIQLGDHLYISCSKNKLYESKAMFK